MSASLVEQLRLAKIDEVRFVSPERPMRAARVPSRAVLNMKAREIQARLARTKYVTWKEVVYELLEAYECEHIGQLDLAQVDHLDAIAQLIRLQKRVDTFIMTYDSRVPCVCLLDLEHALCMHHNHSLTRFATNEATPVRQRTIRTIRSKEKKILFGDLSGCPHGS